MDIKGSIVLVTGGNRGLGKAFVQKLLEAGAKKVYVGSRTPIEATDPRLQPIKLDVTNEQDIAAVAEAAQDVNILINNAGIASSTSVLTEPSIQIARDIMETNYFGMLAMVRAFAPILKKNGGGTIVNVLSVLSWFTTPTTTSYAATKAAALLLTDGIRVELRSQGTQVVAVHVGFMDTDMATHVDPSRKVSPVDVATSVIEGVINGQEEVLADETSRYAKAALASDKKSFYQPIQADWDKAQQQI
ncbi:short-chain dehydrogenase/reductase [Dictyobacter alpinus]|uniref:Short-chain dehydrogenase/reductase n=1 Tax=Dictyobacter alpinus TaxID=2014873 RepID=A0A402BIF7_9CHLR|nr:SDR family oxidoreductase [Dictyobacter alpinus]GCE31188.1 short-chain dehydrogenase/reductase [Dictyobacter alpinus]